MSATVVDASAVAALAFGEPEAERLAGLLTGRTLIGPTLLPYEVANVAVMKRRRRTLSRTGAEKGLAIFERLDITLYQPRAAEIGEIADGTGLTAYDGAYVWLALRFGADLVTLDRRVMEAYVRLRG